MSLQIPKPPTLDVVATAGYFVHVVSASLARRSANGRCCVVPAIRQPSNPWEGYSSNRAGIDPGSDWGDRAKPGPDPKNQKPHGRFAWVDRPLRCCEPSAAQETK